MLPQCLEDAWLLTLLQSGSRWYTDLIPQRGDSSERLTTHAALRRTAEAEYFGAERWAHRPWWLLVVGRTVKLWR